MKPKEVAEAKFAQVKGPDTPHNLKKPIHSFFLQDGIWKPKTSQWYDIIEYSYHNVDPVTKQQWTDYPVEKQDNFDFWDILKYKKVSYLVKGIRLVMHSTRFNCSVDLDDVKLTEIIEKGRGGYIVGHFFIENQKSDKNTKLGVHEIVDLNG